MKPTIRILPKTCSRSRNTDYHGKFPDREKVEGSTAACSSHNYVHLASEREQVAPWPRRLGQVTTARRRKRARGNRPAIAAAPGMPDRFYGSKVRLQIRQIPGNLVGFGG